MYVLKIRYTKDEATVMMQVKGSRFYANPLKDLNAWVYFFSQLGI